MKVTLILLLWLVGGTEPHRANIQTDTLKDCLRAAEEYLTSDMVKNSVAATAGCVVANVPSQETKSE